MAEEKYLLPEEIARELRVSPETVRAWIRAGKLSAYRVGVQLRVERTEYQRFLDASRTNGTSQQNIR